MEITAIAAAAAESSRVKNHGIAHREPGNAESLEDAESLECREPGKRREPGECRAGKMPRDLDAVVCRKKEKWT
jgi:hypothetical protein